MVFSANKIDCHEILLTVALNTITQALDEITQQKPLLLNDVHLYIHLGYGVTLHPGTLLLINSAATSALGFPTSLLLNLK